MLWLVDLDRAVAEERLEAAEAAALKARARDDAVRLAISTLEVGGTLAVLGGLYLWVERPIHLIVLGLIIVLLAAVLLVVGRGRARLPLDAAGVIGMASVIGGAFWMAVADLETTAPAVWFGLAFALGGLMLTQYGPSVFSRFGAWTAALGAAAHLGGVFGLDGDPDLAWLAFADAALILAALGLLLDIRLLSALAVPALAGIASAHGYGRGSYFLAILEPTMVAVAMAALGALLAALAGRVGERLARHARIAGLLAFVWANMALWVASIWGDKPGASFVRPRVDDFPDRERWLTALATWRESGLQVPSELYAVIWAMLLLGIAIWAGLTGRRSVLNAALTFGAIHFYTQWFEAFQDAPLALVAAGIITIAGAWGTHRLNQRMR
ncbi:MAG: hypothetical protein AAF577_01140 [Pseudomonadota bacterium]